MDAATIIMIALAVILTIVAYFRGGVHLIGLKLGHVLCGGDLSGTQTVSEQYLLDLEREAFLSLLGERKSLERIQSLLQTGKPLRN